MNYTTHGSDLVLHDILTDAIVSLPEPIEGVTREGSTLIIQTKVATYSLLGDRPENLRLLKVRDNPSTPPAEEEKLPPELRRGGLTTEERLELWGALDTLDALIGDGPSDLRRLLDEFKDLCVSRPSPSKPAEETYEIPEGGEAKLLECVKARAEERKGYMVEFPEGCLENWEKLLHGDNFKAALLDYVRRNRVPAEAKYVGYTELVPLSGTKPAEE